MHKRAFQGLKRTFIHVACLPPPDFDLKNELLFKLVLLSKYGVGRPKTCIDVRTFIHVSDLPPQYFD